ncbi:SUMF1/EgtB/PvdO family nonheme iron enzyme [Glaciecola sp. SC05]|uniref:SUMF1/EgtB/PvdO family nonheme iron enzyme n=1 Tax=Glaciecola sp. SC05 TaxID=1987355 RepID=UPI003529C546
MQIDDRIKQAQRRGAGLYLLGALLTAMVVGGVLTWLFLVRGYVLNIGPEDATPIATVSLVSGTAWVSDNKVYTLGGAVSVEVDADTFEPSLVTIASDSPSNIEIMLQPSPAILRATLSVMGETSWYVDNELVYVGNNLEYLLAEGEYELTANNPYFMPWDTAISAQRAEIIDLDIALTAVQGTAVINTQPAGAQVIINNEVLGNSPLSIDLEGGKYALSTNLENYQAVQDNIEITFNQPMPARNYQLQAVQAMLDIGATPSDGALLINNIEKPLGAHSLDAKASHSIVYRKVGYFPYSTKLTLAPNEIRTLNIALQPELGKLSLSSNIQANVSIDGQPSGLVSNQSRAFNLAAKPTQIIISKEGYRTVTQSVTPTSQRELVLDVNLLTEFDARRKEGRPLIANQMGINLLKFRPDAYQMGSPANETGRRRNEHQVNVDFDRDIWVSEHEITQAQYARFSGKSSNSQLPQTDITWNEAARFANWLSEQEGLPVFYKVRGTQVVGYDINAKGYRLPTEAEWEWLAKKAKRSRTTVYVWGDQTRIPTNVGNFADQSAKSNQLIVLDNYDDNQPGVAPVGSFKADRIGLHDLAGNVSEWVNDFYTTALPDTDNVQMNYMGATRGTQYVVKGGNYTSGRLRELRGAFREVGESAKPTIGFRIARYD